MKSQQEQMKSFIESECRSLGCEGLSDALSTGYAACCEAVSVQENTTTWETCESMIKRVLEYLTWNKDYSVKGHYGHRNLSSDGWFEIEYNLVDRNDPDKSVYLTTYCADDPSLEQEWNGREDCPVEPNQIEWDTDRNEYHNMAYALENIIECDATRNDLPPEMVAEIVPFLKSIGHLDNFGTSGNTPACESVEQSDTRHNTDMAEHLVEKAIRYLIDNKGYYVSAHDTHRYIDSDGWFELQFELRGGSDPNTSVYLNTHNDHDQDFEDEWMNKGDDETYGYDDIMWDPYTLHDYAYALEDIIECDATRNDLPPEMVAEIVPFLKSIGYLENLGTSGNTPACESVGDTVRKFFGKKKEPEEPQDEFFIRPYGGDIHQPNRYPGLIWSILGEISCDHGGKITKEQAIGYIKMLIPAIKENPDMPTFEKTLYRVVNAIE